MSKRTLFAATLFLTLLSATAHAATRAAPEGINTLTDTAQDILLLKHFPTGWTIDKVLLGQNYHPGDPFNLPIPQYPGQDNQSNQLPDFTACIVFIDGTKLHSRPTVDGVRFIAADDSVYRPTFGDFTHNYEGGIILTKIIGRTGNDTLNDITDMTTRWAAARQLANLPNPKDRRDKIFQWLKDHADEITARLEEREPTTPPAAPAAVKKAPPFWGSVPRDLCKAIYSTGNLEDSWQCLKLTDPMRIRADTSIPFGTPADTDFLLNIFADTKSELSDRQLAGKTLIYRTNLHTESERLAFFEQMKKILAEPSNDLRPLAIDQIRSASIANGDHPKLVAALDTLMAQYPRITNFKDQRNLLDAIAYLGGTQAVVKTAGGIPATLTSTSDAANGQLYSFHIYPYRDAPGTAITVNAANAIATRTLNGQSESTPIPLKLLNSSGQLSEISDNHFKIDTTPLTGPGWSFHLEGTITIDNQQFPWHTDPLPLNP